MSAPPTTQTDEIRDPSQWVWPEDVLALANKKNVLPYLTPLLDMTRAIIPQARWLHVYVSHDPEIPDWKTIVFDVGLPDTCAKEYVDLQKRWGHEWLQLCPYPREPIFNLLLDTGETWTGPHFST